MVNHFTISCLHCGKVFDEESRRPCLGKCSHSICHQCHISQDTKTCPVCQKENAFEETVINYQSVQVLKALRDQLTPENFLTVSEDLENLDNGKCSECSNHSKKLRICVNCVKPHKIISQGFENSFALELVEKNFERSFLKAKNLAICAECALETKHEKHKVIPLRSVSRGFDVKDLLANGALLEQKLRLENDFGDWQTIVTHYKSVLARFQLRISMRNENLCGGLSSIKMPSKPKWELAMKKSRDAVTAMHKRNERRMDRMLKYEEDHLQKHLEFATMKWTASSSDFAPSTSTAPVEDDTLPKAIYQLQEILQKIQDISDLVHLSEEEVLDIDTQVESAMTSLESEMVSRSLVPLDEDDEDEESQLFKYKVIISEYQSSISSVENTKKQMMTKILELRNLEIKYSGPLKKCQEQQKLLGNAETLDFMNQIQNTIISNTKMFAFMHELVEKQLEVDQFITAYLEATGRKKMADLMKYRYFPEIPGRTAEDQGYIELINEFLNGNRNDSMHVMF